ncbi:hypothetical protein AEAC466_04360 [Asticcacaulis sp. AC466]|nr:hypothetical protein AEAC466_04360 [Asticcacaulis sp. AC466]
MTRAVASAGRIGFYAPPSHLSQFTIQGQDGEGCVAIMNLVAGLH